MFRWLRAVQAQLDFWRWWASPRQPYGLADRREAPLGGGWRSQTGVPPLGADGVSHRGRNGRQPHLEIKLSLNFSFSLFIFHFLCLFYIFFVYFSFSLFIFHFLYFFFFFIFLFLCLFFIFFVYFSFVKVNFYIFVFICQSE